MGRIKLIYRAGLLLALGFGSLLLEGQSDSPERSEVQSEPVRGCGRANTRILGVESPEARPLTLTPGHKQLFLDNYVLLRLEGVRRRLHQPRKQGPVLRADRPWERGVVQIRTAPSWNPEKKIWMLWYYASGEPDWVYCYASSRDGTEWEKPSLGLVDYKGTRQNNLLSGMQDEIGLLNFIFYDTKDPDPERRYKAFSTKKYTRFYPAVSPDGLRWRVLKTSIPTEDEAHLFYDERKNLYVATVKHQGPYGRAVYLSLSTDFEHWTDPRDCLIFHADERDQELGTQMVQKHLQSPDLLKPVLNRPEEYETDIYNLPVFAYEGIYIGMPTVFNHSGDSDGFSMSELAVSRDLIHWERVGNREKFLPLSPLEGGKNYDTGQLLVSNRPILRDNELWFYYTALRRRTYAEDIEAKRFLVHPDSGAICLAKVRLDGFVSLDATETPGQVVTKPLVIEGKGLHLNLDTPHGEVRAEILNAANELVPGFSMDDCVPATGDKLDAELRWKSGKDLSSLAGQTVSIRFSLRHASLYAFWTKN